MSREYSGEALRIRALACWSCSRSPLCSGQEALGLLFGFFLCDFGLGLLLYIGLGGILVPRMGNTVSCVSTA
ncbi:hypothetical protein BJX99DRAFT_222728 [Aspergillus californicus]